jgi:hypothetical protein
MGEPAAGNTDEYLAAHARQYRGTQESLAHLNAQIRDLETRREFVIARAELAAADLAAAILAGTDRPIATAQIGDHVYEARRRHRLDVPDTLRVLPCRRVAAR